MLARDQNLLLQPEVNPSVGLRHLHGCVQLAGAWRKLGGNATLIHGDLPGRLTRQLEELSIELLPLDSVDRVTAGRKPGWLFVDGAGSSLPALLECSNSSGMNPAQRWMLAATREWAEANGTRFQSPDLLLESDDAARSLDTSRSDCVLRGGRYQMPATGGPLADFQSDEVAVPTIARKILIWLSEEDSSFNVAETLSDVIEAASVRTTVDVVATTELRDSPAIVNLKKSNPETTIRFWTSIDRRLQSMAPIHLAIVDSEAKMQSVAQREIPVVCPGVDDGALQGLKGAASFHSQTASKTVNAAFDRPNFRRLLSRLIRNRDQRQSLVDSAVETGDVQAADRIARRLATSDLRLEPAAVDDWSEVSRWQCDPESLASALPCGDRDAHAGRNEAGRNGFAASLNRRKSNHWMFRLSSGMPIGMASLDPYEPMGGNSARVQVLINPTLRNLGYGSVLLERVLEQAEGSGDFQQVIFQARSNDQAARRMAAKAGLLPVAPTVVAGVVAHQFAIELKSVDRPVMERSSMQRSA